MSAGLAAATVRRGSVLPSGTVTSAEGLVVVTLPVT